ncbi:hepatoma-derived growth factor-related protein 2-like [Pollicipes pollicipes]|uniref:hepatoma-derived growth factor-related protein 2-like n=1 Tax=Pollicipes pollicipes TaxID=41117 RepID=UPI001885436C|nr:hepatoma-derived growth factor-related protein 2-like [Pollicipes pollicipes]
MRRAKLTLTDSVDVWRLRGPNQAGPGVTSMRQEAAERARPARPVSLSSASSSDSGVRADLSDASSTARRRRLRAALGDSGCPGQEPAWEDDDWDSASDASGEYEPLRAPTGSQTLPPAPPPPPPRSVPGGRRKDLARHLGLPHTLGGSLAELRAAATAHRKDLALFLGLEEPATPRVRIWRRWTSRRPRERQRTVNASLPDLARLGERRRQRRVHTTCAGHAHRPARHRLAAAASSRHSPRAGTRAASGDAAGAWRRGGRPGRRRPPAGVPGEAG